MQATLILEENKNLIALFVSFIQEIGLTVKLAVHEEPGFFSGVKIENGGLSIDPDKVLYPGDILHEAGHLATLPHHIRCGLDGQLPDIDMHRGAELMSLAWSYAAAMYLKVPPHVIFHEHGYKGGSKDLIANFEKGIPIGLPMLQYQEMAYDEENAERLKVRPFPYMVNWTCLKQHLP